MNDRQNSLVKQNEPKGLILKSADEFERLSVVAEDALKQLELAEKAPLKRDYIMACAMHQLMYAMTDELMKPIMALQGTSLGFKTDRDNKGGYSLPEVRKCAVAAKVMGLNLTGNEFNIISSQCYVTKQGFQGLMMRSPHFVDVDINMGIPEIRQKESRAIVKYSATWKYQKRDYRIEEDSIPIKWDQYSSNDAILGKAERKIRHRIWVKSTGNYVDDGDIGDDARVASAKDVTPRKSSNIPVDANVIDPFSKTPDAPKQPEQPAAQPEPTDEEPDDLLF